MGASKAKGNFFQKLFPVDRGHCRNLEMEDLDKVRKLFTVLSVLKREWVSLLSQFVKRYSLRD
jgi:hypothetical protein